MGHFSQKIIAILVSAGMLVQMKFVTWGERAAVAGTGDQVVGGFFFFHAKFGDGVAFGFINVDAGIVINFVFGVATDLGDGLHVGHQGRVRRLKVIVGECVLAGAQLLFSAPAPHDVFLQERAAGGVVEAHFMLGGTVFVHLGLVGKNQLVSVLIVLEEIEDAVLFHQARDKVEGGLAILDNVFALGIAALGAVLKILKAVVLKNFFHDFGNSLLLKNLAIGGTGEEPEPGDNFGVVITEAIVTAHASEAADKAIPIPLVITGMVDLESHLLADNVLERDGMVFGEEVR